MSGQIKKRHRRLSPRPLFVNGSLLPLPKIVFGAATKSAEFLCQFIETGSRFTIRGSHQHRTQHWPTLLMLVFGYLGCDVADLLANRLSHVVVRFAQPHDERDIFICYGSPVLGRPNQLFTNQIILARCRRQCRPPSLLTHHDWQYTQTERPPRGVGSGDTLVSWCHRCHPRHVCQRVANTKGLVMADVSRNLRPEPPRSRRRLPRPVGGPTGTPGEARGHGAV